MNKGFKDDHLNCIKDPSFVLFTAKASNYCYKNVLVFLSASWSLQLCSVKRVEVSRYTFLELSLNLYQDFNVQTKCFSKASSKLGGWNWIQSRRVIFRVDLE